MPSKRYVEFDLLRAAVVFSAFVQHFNQSIGIGPLAEPSRLVQSYVFTVGGYFFFTAGYMASRIYLPRFRDDKLGVTKHLVRKGGEILALYFGYVVFMHIATRTPLPTNFVGLAFGHRFYTKVLLSFGVLYVTMPVLLLLSGGGNRLFLLVLAVLSALFVAYSSSWNMANLVRRSFFDRKMFLYPMLPTYITFMIGFLVAQLDRTLCQRHTVGKLALISASVLIVHMGLLAFPAYRAILLNRRIYTFIESLTPFFALLVTRFAVSWGRSRQIFVRPQILCVGIDSLTFYVGSNLLLGLTRLSRASPPTYRLLVFLGITLITYSLTRWHYGSVLYKLASGRLAQIDGDASTPAVSG